VAYMGLGPDVIAKTGASVLPSLIKKPEVKGVEGADERTKFKTFPGMSKAEADELGLLWSPNPKIGGIARSPLDKPQSITVGYKPQYDVGLQEELAAARARGAAVGKREENAPSQAAALEAVQDAKEIFKQGIYTGAYAEVKKGLAKYTPGVDSGIASNTEAFVSAVGNTVVPRLKEFGGNDSNEEMKYLREIQGGNIKMEAAAIENILDRSEAYIRRGIYRRQNGADVDTPVKGEPKIPPRAGTSGLSPSAPATGRGGTTDVRKKADEILRGR